MINGLANFGHQKGSGRGYKIGHLSHLVYLSRGQTEQPSVFFSIIFDIIIIIKLLRENKVTQT
jgi:hypothetical protein